MDLFQLSAQKFDGTEELASIVSGPVIINEEGKFLLHIAPSTGKWQFTGGRMTTVESPIETAMRKSREVLGCECNIDQTVAPFVIEDVIERDGNIEHLTLIHFKASVSPDDTLSDQVKWFTYGELEKLGSDNMLSSHNVLLAARHFSR